MRLPRGRGLVRLGAGAAVLAVACLAGLSGGPAFAADSLGSQADLAVHVPGPQVALGAGEKDIRIDVTNHGPGNVLHGKLTIGTDNLADGVSVDLPTGSGCETQGTKVVCDLDALPAGGHDSTVSVFLAHDPKVAKVGPVGSLSVSVSSELADPDMTNNSETVQLELVNPGIDLFVQGFDVQLSPGQSATLPFTVLNQGTVATVTTDVAVRLPEFVTFVADPACDLSEHDSAAVCHFGALAPGDAGEGSGFQLTLAADAPGPVALTGGTLSASGVAAEDPAPPALKSAAARPHKTFAKIKPQAAPSRDASPGDDVADFTVFTTENPADLAVTATAASGHVGDTVSIAVTVKNNGPATVTDAAATITAPSGTTIVDQLGCATVTAGKVVKCTGTLKSGESNTGTFKFRIDNATVGPDGKATIASSIKDPNLTNNTAAITITVLPTGLPITGARAGLIGGAGLAVLLVGGVLVVMARRRRYVLVAPRDNRD